ncbi:origin recognition complex subunit 5 [Tachypleus tridentatus]|uniref:origin recognition complex subunit 5 n=1 Tax=Tachypleus tridentatus TaxID=6853 RepID=UPI003FD074B6
MDHVEVGNQCSLRNEEIQKIQQSVRARKKQMQVLLGLLGEENEAPCDCIFVYGHEATGKTYLLSKIMEEFQIPYAWINCVEIYSQRLLYEGILNQLFNSTYSVTTLRCDNMCDFIQLFKQEAQAMNLKKMYIILDNAEKLRNFEPTLLAALMRLQELSELDLSVILISEIIWEKFRCGIGLCEPLQLHFPQYNREEVLEILSLDCPPGYSEEFYTAYLRVVLSVFYLVTRNLRELKYLALLNFPKYCEPIKSGTVSETDQHKLWKNIEPRLKEALNTVYLCEISSFQWGNYDTKGAIGPAKKVGDLTQSFRRAAVELPFYSKFLLIASYLASYNPPRTDKKFFVKNQGKVKKKNVNLRKDQPKSHILGPKPFPLDRMMAIFYSIVDEQVPPTSMVFSQITTLVTLRLLATTSNGEELNTPKYKCLVGLDFIRNVSQTVKFDILSYLNDFI